MDVQVDWIRRIERLRRPGRPSLLGDGLLERARSTTLALLGVTAAVGLAIVALVLQQSWPHIGGSPLPDPPAVAVDKGVAVAGQTSGGEASAARTRPGPRGDGPTRSAASEVPVSAESPVGSSGVTSASPVPVGGEEPQPEGSGPDRPSPPPPRSAPTPPPAPAAAPPSEQTSAPTRVANPASPPAAEPQSLPGPPVAVASSHPGEGHAYGKGNGNGPPGGEPPGQAKKKK